jgi:hypothetical protein
VFAMQRPASLSDVDVAEAFNVSRIEQAVREDTQATTSVIDRNGDKQAREVRLAAERQAASLGAPRLRDEGVVESASHHERYQQRAGEHEKLKPLHLAYHAYHGPRLAVRPIRVLG